VDAAVLSESVLLVAENAVGLGVFRACVFDKCGPELKEVVHEGDGAVVVEEGGVTFLM
jgi:hypothetical protein